MSIYESGSWAGTVKWFVQAPIASENFPGRSTSLAYHGSFHPTLVYQILPERLDTLAYSRRGDLARTNSNFTCIVLKTL